LKNRNKKIKNKKIKKKKKDRILKLNICGKMGISAFGIGRN
jgi:hypothetical protein